MGTITGTNGNDTIIGTDGSDIINSGNGDDIVNGGAGSDQINGGAGSDTLIYTVSENLGGFKDVYTGGSGIDTVRIQLSYEQWSDPAVRWELERYVKFLSTVKMNSQGEVSNGSASDFIFNFGTSTLTVQMMEKLAVWVKPESGGDYAQVDYLTSLITGDAAGRVVEAGGAGDSNPGTPTVTGQLKSDDLNGVDNLFQSVDTSKAAKYGSYTVSSNGEWKYTLNNADSRVQELATNDTLSDSFTVSSADGAVKVITITIVGSNDAPVVTGELSSTAAEGSSLYSMNLLDGASDVDHGQTASLGVTEVGYSVDGVAVPDTPAGVSLAGGTLSVDPTHGAFDHLAIGEETTIVVSYNIKDTQGATVAQQATITIKGTNDVPVVTGALTMGEDEGEGSYEVNLLEGASDVDHNETASLSVADVTYSVDGGNPSGSAPAGVVLNGNKLAVDTSNGAFDHLAVGAHTTIVVSYNVKDVHGAAVAQVATITIDGTNDAPVLSTALVSTAAEGAGAYTMNLLAGASDADDGETDSLSLANIGYSVDGGQVSTTAPAGLSLSGKTLTVDPSNSAFDHLAAGEHATILLTYDVKDAQGATVAQSATITVTGTNDAPLVSAALTSEQAEGAGSYDLNLLAGASDVDHDETATLGVANVTYSVDGSAPGGAPAGVSLVGNTLTVNPANSAFDHLAVGEHSTIVVNYSVKDAQGATVDQSATITITGTNDAPIVSAALSSTAAEGAGAYAMNLLTGASDADHDESATLSVANVEYTVDGVAVAGVPAGFSLVSNTLTVDPTDSIFDHLAVGEHSTVVINYNVKDAQGATVAQSATITITGTNDVPVVTGPVTGSATEDGGPMTLNALANASDVDRGSALDVVSLPATLPNGVSYSAATHSFTLDASHSSYQSLAAGEVKDVVVDYGVSDGIATVAESLKFTVTGINDAPVLISAATPVLANVLQNAGGPSGAVGTLVSSLVNLNPPAGGLDNVSDADSGAVTGIALTSTNTANGTWWYSMNGGTSWTAVGSVSNSSALLLSADANTRIYFQGNTGYSGTVGDGVTFRAWDGTSGTAGALADTSVNGGSSAFSSATDIAAITVAANNLPPVGVADRIIVSNNTFVTLSASALLGNDTDIDGYALALTGVSGASGITGLTLNANAGTISFTSNNNATSGSFQYTVSDGAGGSATASVTIDIRAVTNNNNTGDMVDLSTAGTYQASYIDAGGGPDIVTGGATGDVFIGGTGNAADTLNGSAGNDLLSGNGGDDQLSGGSGNDVLTGGLGDDRMDGGAGSDDMLDFSDGTVALNFTLAQNGAFTGTGGAGGLGTDTYANIEGVIGTGLADTINGSAGNDVIRGGAGNDILDGKGGSDLLDFSDGTAGITFTLVNNAPGTFAGSAAGLGSDTYTGFEGAIGTAFADNLAGTASADQLRGGGGNDVINGQSGDDRIVGGSGTDMLTGGAGRDTFVFDTAPNAVDSVTDFNASGTAPGGDWIELSLATFTGIATAAGNLLSSSEFSASAGGGATDVVAAGIRVIYDSTTGNLYYDSDGQGAANRTLFATLTLENPGDTFNQNDIRIGS